VGGSNGEVAYSLNGGNTFTKIPEDIGEGDVQVIADINYGENGIIYASAGEGVYRWSIGASTTWQRIVKESSIASLAIGNEGTLYALSSEDVIRLLNPSTSNTAEIDLIDLPAGNSFPILKLLSSSEENELWTIGADSDIIYYLTDTLCKVAPILDAPSEGATIPLDSIGRVSHLSLSWNELPEVTIYEIAIYLDSDCTQRVWLGNSDTTNILIADEDNTAGLTAGTTYYWRTRSITPLKSSWSELRNFTIGLGSVRATCPTSTTGVPVSNISFTWNSYPSATEYEFTLSQKADLTAPIVAEKVSSTAYEYTGTLDYGTTYFWGVRITKPAFGPLSVFTFTTRAAPVKISPPISPPVITPIWVWVLIGICVALVTVTIILIFRTHQT
jgi:hypothetical protein